jgi:hypothetical protein
MRDMICEHCQKEIRDKTKHLITYDRERFYHFCGSFCLARYEFLKAAAKANTLPEASRVADATVQQGFWV